MARKALPWVIGGVVLAVIVTVLVVALSRDDVAGSDDSTPISGDATAPTSEKADLSSPDKAAESFATAVAAGDGPAIAELTCVADDACVEQYSKGADPAELAEARDKIVEGADELAAQLKGAEFGAVADGPEPGMKQVEYRTPAMAAGETGYLIFAEFDRTWLFMGGGAKTAP
jgi:hypothetical protein